MKYFLSQDNDCHWYIVLNENRKEWCEWVELDEDDEKSWDVPNFAQAINNPYGITFNEFEEQ